MNTKHWWVAGLGVAALATVAGSAQAQNKLDPDSFKRWGGTYLSDCANNASPRITVFEEALVFLEGDKRIASSQVQAAFSYFGRSPPEGYEVALLGDISEERQLLAIVHHDDEGYYILLDADPKTRDQISPSVLKLKYRRCGSASEGKSASAPKPASGAAPATGAKPAAPTPGAAPAAGGAPATGAAPAGASASDPLPDAVGMIADPAFKTAYYKALGKYKKEPWLAQLDGPTPPSRKVTVDGTEYLQVSSCKNHDCADNNTVLLYLAAKKLVYGKIHLAGKSAMIGNPPPAVSKEIGALWLEQWRPNP